MNDPAESENLIPGASFASEHANPMEAWGATIQRIKEARDRIRLLSLTHDVIDYDGVAKVFGCCWAHPRLWEHYADKHRGICLVFDKQPLEEALQDSLGKDCVIFDEVEYTSAGIADSAATFITAPGISDVATREQAVIDYMECQRQDLFFLKTDDWATECEFRAVLLGTDNKYALADYGRALTAVVLGGRFPEWQVAGAQAICDKAGVVLKSLTWLNGMPHLGKASRTPRPARP